MFLGLSPLFAGSNCFLSILSLNLLLTFFPPARCYHRGQLAEPIAELVLNFDCCLGKIRPYQAIFGYIFAKPRFRDPVWQFTMGGKSGESLAPPPGYAKIDADLNAGAFFGEKITLCVRPTPLKNGGDHSFTRYGTAFWCRFSGSWRNKKKRTNGERMSKNGR